MDEGVNLGGNLYSRGAAPYDDEGQLGLRGLAAGEGGLLEAFDHPVADAQSVPQPSHRHAVLLDARDAKKFGWPPRASTR